MDDHLNGERFVPLSKKARVVFTNGGEPGVKLKKKKSR